MISGISEKYGLELARRNIPIDKTQEIQAKAR